MSKLVLIHTNDGSLIVDTNGAYVAIEIDAASPQPNQGPGNAAHTRGQLQRAKSSGSLRGSFQGRIRR